MVSVKVSNTAGPTMCDKAVSNSGPTPCTAARSVHAEHNISVNEPAISPTAGEHTPEMTKAIVQGVQRHTNIDSSCTSGTFAHITAYSNEV